MAPKKKGRRSNKDTIDLKCLNCSKVCYGHRNRKGTIVCVTLRLHIRQDQDMPKGVIDLLSSNTSHDRKPPPNNKRKATDEASGAPPLKQILLSELNEAFLEEHFGALPISNQIQKGQSFGDKTQFNLAKTWVAPSTANLNKIFCPQDVFMHRMEDKRSK